MISKGKYLATYLISLVITEAIVFLLYFTNELQMRDYWTEESVPVLDSIAKGCMTMIAVAVAYTLAWAFLTVVKEIFAVHRCPNCQATFNDDKEKK